MFYTTCEFNVSPALKDKLGYLVDFQSPSNLYACFPNIGKENKMFNMALRDNDHCKHSSMLTFYI